MTMIEKRKIYQHYKGGLYECLYLSTDEESGKRLITYKALDKNKKWTRPLDVFKKKFKLIQIILNIKKKES